MTWLQVLKIIVRIITVLPIVIKGVKAEIKRYQDSNGYTDQVD